MSRCRECDNERSKRYYAENREERRDAVKAYQAASREPRKCKGCGGPATSQRHHYCDTCRALRPRHRRRERERMRERTRNRPNATDRGYGWHHQQLRKQWARVLQDEPVPCARCGGLIHPGQPWDLGHDDLDRSRYTGPEHRACNRATAGRQTRVTSRQW